MIEIILAETAPQIETERKFFREYEAWLSLSFQGFEQELAELPGKYAPPFGRLFLACLSDRAAGCNAMRKLEDYICEMKRFL